MAAVLTLAETDLGALLAVFDRFGLALQRLDPGAEIPGSYWGEPEAGIIGNTVYARDDTPLHSLLHEACHVICAPPEKRAGLHTDASNCQLEEDATCYLQILLGDELPGIGAARMQQDMDAWGYSFRLGSARAWFEQDAEDARAWLLARGLIDPLTHAATSLAADRRGH
ncbi:MAG: hypothetical protein HYV17_01225 [Xanthomonadales bacterium]|nr:hypothetical protein [Xanthomonadales bacterium]